MIISLVVAAAENNAIGKDNQLLWKLPNDMKFFKNITWGLPVIMGRKTFEALGKPLPGRTNIVITRQAGWEFDKVITSASLEDAIKKAGGFNFKEAAIIGGGEIYKLAIGIATVIYITRVHAGFEDADAFFPVINEEEWELVSNEDFEKDEKHAYNYSFQKWVRK
jgi:dihydrofolate reductase